MGSQQWKDLRPPPAEIPPEFACPISGRLMADPVVILSGHSYERACLQACKNLRVVPPRAPDMAAAEVVIPNLALQEAIFNWCARISHPPPLPLDLSAATLFVHDLPPSSIPETRLAADGLPREVLSGLTAADPKEQQAALLFLRSSTRTDSPDERAAFCEEPILAALQSLLRSKLPALRLNAAAAVVNLSLHPPNRVRLVRAGLVPPLVEALKSQAAEAQDHAAAALFSLSVEEKNRAAIGVLGALPPLLQLTCRNQAEPRTRRDAAMALVHLSTAETNVGKLLRLGAVKALLGLAADPGQGPAALAVVVLRNLAAMREGREGMAEAGAVQALTRVLRGAEEEELKEGCLGALYAMSKAKARFMGMAAAAGLEEVLERLEEEEEEGEGGGRNERMRTMVRRTLRACRAREGEEGSLSESGSWDSGEYGGGFVGNLSAPVLGPRADSVRKAHGAHTTRF